MIRWGLFLAVVLIAAGAWFDWSYHAVRTEIAELQSRLTAQPDGPAADTKADCARVNALKQNLIAKLFKGDELDALAKLCENTATGGAAETSP